VKENETRHQRYTIRREPHGYRVIETASGIAIGTLGTWAGAVRFAEEHTKINWLVATLGEDEAIDLMFRKGLKSL